MKSFEIVIWKIFLDILNINYQILILLISNIIYLILNLGWGLSTINENDFYLWMTKIIDYLSIL